MGKRTSIKSEAAVIEPADKIAILAADKFVASKVAKNAADKDYAASKLVLLDWLDGAACKTLSDGRTVHKTVQQVPAETVPRGPSERTILSVSPKPAA